MNDYPYAKPDEIVSALQLVRIFRDPEIMQNVDIKNNELEFCVDILEKMRKEYFSIREYIGQYVDVLLLPKHISSPRLFGDKSARELCTSVDDFDSLFDEAMIPNEKLREAQAIIQRATGHKNRVSRIPKVKFLKNKQLEKVKTKAERKANEAKLHKAQKSQSNESAPICA